MKTSYIISPVALSLGLLIGWLVEDRLFGWAMLFGLMFIWGLTGILLARESKRAPE